MSVRVAKIFLYPIKSLDGVEVASASLTRAGGFVDDRRWAMVDLDGRVINGKRCPDLHRLRTNFDLAARTVSFQGGRPIALGDSSSMARQLTELLEQEIGLIENADGGFPDDTQAAGPTFITTSTLIAVADWFGLSHEEARRRFRANVELGPAPAFWEDKLYAADEPRSFRVGAANLVGTNPCQRCPVPSRDSQTGEVTPLFAKTFSRRREETLPAWVPRSRFDHFYKLSVNTRRCDSDEVAVRVGDAINIEDDITA